MNAPATALTLRPATISLRIEGTAVPCETWHDAIAILANQARINRAPTPMLIQDADSRSYGAYTVAESREVQENLEAAPHGAGVAHIVLGDWSLSTPRGQLASFQAAAAARDRLQLVANTTGHDIPVTVHCLDAEGTSTIHIHPEGVSDETPTPQIDETTLTEAVHDAEPDPSAGETTPNAEPENAAPDAEESPLGAILGIPEVEDPALEEAEADTEDQTRPGHRRRNRLLAILSILLLLILVLVIAGLGLLRLIPRDPAPTPTAFGQTVATDPVPAVSRDHATIAAVTPKGLEFVDAASGASVGSVDTVATDRDIYPLTAAGFYVTGSEPQVCTRQDTMSCTPSEAAPKGSTLIHRAGTVAYTSKKSRDVRVVTNKGLDTYHAPSSRSAYIGQNEQQALWAEATTTGGKIIHAAQNGAAQRTTTLAAPTKDAKLLSWAGPTDRGTIAVLWSKDKDTNTMAFHDPATGKATQHVEIPAGAKGNISVTDTGSLILAKHTAVTSEAKAVPLSDLTDPKISSDAITAKNGAVAGTGRSIPTKEGQTFITDNGDSAILVENDALTSTAITD